MSTPIAFIKSSSLEAIGIPLGEQRGSGVAGDKRLPDGVG
jgi:hypothetical protein